LKIHETTFAACIAIFMFLGGPAAGDEKSVIDSTVRGLIEKGEVLLIDEPGDGKPQFVTAGLLVTAPMEAVFKVITDFERYPKVFPEVTRTKIVKREGSDYYVDHTVTSSLSIMPISIRYQLKFTVKAPDELHWELVEGDLRASTGYWKLVSVNDGKATAAFYRVYFDIVPKGFLIKLVMEYITEKSPAFGTAVISSAALTVVKSVKDTAEGRGMKGDGKRKRKEKGNEF